VVQVVIGFGYRAVFEPGFDKLPGFSRDLHLVALTVMLVAFGILVTPAAFHRIVSEGNDDEDVHRFTSRAVVVAFGAFAVGLGSDAYIAARKTVGLPAAALVGGGVLATALFFWYALTLWYRRRRHMKRGSAKHGGEEEETE